MTSFAATPSSARRPGKRRSPPCTGGCCSRALDQSGLEPGEVDFVLGGGPLLNQCIGSSFGLREFGIPFYGLYGACSTMGEALALAALLIDGGFAATAAAHGQLPLLHGGAAVPDAGALRQPENPHRPVDGHRRRLHSAGGAGGGTLSHPCALREDRGQGYLGSPTTWARPWRLPPMIRSGRFSEDTGTAPAGL